MKAHALHPLLFENPEGVTLDDVADELALPRAEAKAMLDAEAIAGAIAVECSEDGALLYRSNRRVRPARSVSQALSEIARAGAETRARERARRAVAVAALALAAFVSLMLAMASHRAATPAPVVAAPTVPLPLERAAAAQAAEQRSLWREERDRLVAARTQLAAASQTCADAWGRGESCYFGGRLLERAQHANESARVAVRLTELDGLLPP